MQINHEWTRINTRACFPQTRISRINTDAWRVTQLIPGRLQVRTLLPPGTVALGGRPAVRVTKAAPQNPCTRGCDAVRHRMECK
jgi:hypothetical protein